MKEAYVSFEIAQLLKEKGFKEDCIMGYIDNELMNVYDDDYPSMYELENTGDDVVNAPTHQMAMAWLRINHKIFIRPNIIFARCPVGYYCEILCYGDNLQTQQDVSTEDFETPEEAVEAALKYSLINLI